jgi:fermentation-respiration switch protein FrsA (DUF1100 family)
MYYPVERASITVLYSHGNAEDVGLAWPWLVRFAEKLQVNVLAYDYQGYGLSLPRYDDSSSCAALAGDDSSASSATMPKQSAQSPPPSPFSMLPDISSLFCGILPSSGGTGAGTDMHAGMDMSSATVPNETACYRDIDAAYSFLVQEKGCHPSKILLMGRSLGSGPSCYLAERLSLQGVQLGGLILQSALASVFRVAIDLQTATLPGDRFPNIDRMCNIADCPVLVIHGTKDSIVPFSHGEQLFNLAPEAWRSCLWVPDGGHNDIDNIQGFADTSYLASIRSFISEWVTHRRPLPQVAIPAKLPSSA